MANEQHTRPSRLVGIERSDPYAAWCLDEAVYIWGSHVEAELHHAGKDAKNEESAVKKRQGKLDQLLRDGEVPEGPTGLVSSYNQEEPPPAEPVKGQFADPATMFNRR